MSGPRERRRWLRILGGVPVGRGLLALGAGVGLTTPATTLAATSPCVAPAEQTIPETEGPYFTANSPRRGSLLEPGMPGLRLVLTGRVRSTDCSLLSQVMLDFWQADSEGRYDNKGYRLRGHQFSDDRGGYRLETVMPGIYPGRTRHIHVRVQAAKGPALTTQLYFPGEVRNRTDMLFSPDLLVSVSDAANDPASGGAPDPDRAMSVEFDFVIATA